MYLVGQRTNIFPHAVSGPIVSPTPCPISAPCPSGSSLETTLTLQISASADDVNEVKEGTRVSLQDHAHQIWFGNDGPGKLGFTGLRFNNVSIPQNATIKSAELKVLSTKKQWINISFDLFAESAFASPVFSLSNPPSQRSLTTAKLSHHSNTSWNAATWYSLGDVKGAIQEVINNPAWVNGNSLSLIAKGTGAAYGRKFVSSFDAGSQNAPQLIIKYTTP